MLGVKAVIAESYERIHRSNLVGMGVLPLQFIDGQNIESLGLDGSESFSISGIEKLNENPPAGSRVRALAVAGAFHTSVMKPAVDHVSSFVSKLEISDPKMALLSNKDGATVGSGSDAISRIVSQVANPVRWDLCMTSLRELGITGVIELPPAGTLVGLLKRAEPSIETFALKSPEDLPAAKEFAIKHGGA